jgi:hypothetical protein
MKLHEFTSANPFMAQGEWRQELVAGEVRTVAPHDPATVGRIMALSNALAACLRRSKSPGAITLGSGIGVEHPDGDHFRIADVVLSLPQKRGGRSKPAALFLVVGDAESLTMEEEERLALFQSSRQVKEILIFSLWPPYGRHLRLFSEGWSESVYDLPAADMRLACLSASLFMSQIYPPEEPDDSSVR